MDRTGNACASTNTSSCECHKVARLLDHADELICLLIERGSVLKALLQCLSVLVCRECHLVMMFVADRIELRDVGFKRDGRSLQPQKQTAEEATKLRD